MNDKKPAPWATPAVSQGAQEPEAGIGAEPELEAWHRSMVCECSKNACPQMSSMQQKYKSREFRLSNKGGIPKYKNNRMTKGKSILLKSTQKPIGTYMTHTANLNTLRKFSIQQTTFSEHKIIKTRINF